MWNEVLKQIDAHTSSQATQLWDGGTPTLVSAGINLVYRFELEPFDFGEHFVTQNKSVRLRYQRDMCILRRIK